MSYQKLNPIERALVAAASMPALDARRVLMLICQNGMTLNEPTPQPTPGQLHYSKREKIIKRMKSAYDRVLNYARHETLRNVEKHFMDNSAMSSADLTEEDKQREEAKKKTLSERLTFEKILFSSLLLNAIREEQSGALQTAGQQLFDEVGTEESFQLPRSDAMRFLDTRANLFANTSDEIHREVIEAIQHGLELGESKKELMSRIGAAFDGISDTRTDTIANTETAAAFNYARDKAMREAGVTHKKWLLSHSPFIKEHRPTHVENDGQIQPIDEPFDIGGVKFMHPGDDSLGAGPEDIINCHCVAIPVEAPIESGEQAGHPFRGNQWTGGKPVHESVATLLETLEKAEVDPTTKRLSPGSRFLDLSDLPISKTAAMELHKRGLAGVQTIKLPDKFGVGMQVVEKGKTLTHIFLRDKGRAELGKFRDFEHYKKSISLLQPTHEAPGFGDFVQTPSGTRGIMRGGDPTLGGGHRVRVLDPFEEKKFTYETRSELKKLEHPK